MGCSSFYATLRLIFDTILCYSFFFMYTWIKYIFYLLTRMKLVYSWSWFTFFGKIQTWQASISHLCVVKKNYRQDFNKENTALIFYLFEFQWFSFQESWKKRVTTSVTPSANASVAALGGSACNIPVKNI